MLDLIKNYASKRVELLKMEAVEKSSVVSGTVAFIAILAFLFIFFFLLLNIGLGLLIGHYLDNYGYGVLIMAGFYLVLMLVMFAAKKSLKMAVADRIIKTLNQ